MQSALKADAKFRATRGWGEGVWGKNVTFSVLRHIGRTHPLSTANKNCWGFAVRTDEELGCEWQLWKVRCSRNVWNRFSWSDFEGCEAYENSRRHLLVLEGSSLLPSDQCVECPEWFVHSFPTTSLRVRNPLSVGGGGGSEAHRSYVISKDAEPRSDPKFYF